MECFMRDVLIPLAAETNALIVGSAFRDASLMMMFSRVARTMSSKYGGMGASPWTMLGFAGAPKLLKSLQDPKSTTTEWFKLSKRWQDRKDAVIAAKMLACMGDSAQDEDGDGLVMIMLLLSEPCNESRLSLKSLHETPGQPEANLTKFTLNMLL